MKFDFNVAFDLMPHMLSGIWVTVILLVPTFVVGFVLSIPLALMKRSPRSVIRQPATWYTTFIRGAPQLVVLYLVYNGFPLLEIVRETFLWSFFKEPINCAIFVFSLNHAAFLAEIWRGGLASVPVGLSEAGRSLGLPRWLVFARIEMPLAFRYGLSAYRNEVVLFVKATSVVSAITIFDILGIATEAVSLTFDPFTPLVVAGAIYWCAVQMIQAVFNRLEFHLSTYQAPAR